MKSKQIKKIFIILIFGLLIQYSIAGDVSRIGTAAGMQTAVPVGARYVAMGGANIANVSGIDGLYWNPSGVASLGHVASGVFSTMKIFNDVNVNYIALGVEMGDLGNLAFSLKSFDFGDIPLTTVLDVDGSQGQTFSPTFNTIGITYASRLTDVVKIGITGKLISESVDRASASAFAIDAGIQYENVGGVDGVSFGIVVRNIGTGMQYSGSALTVESSEVGGKYQGFTKREAAEDDLPASFEIGVGYNASIDGHNSILLSSNFNNYNFGSDAVRFGAEYVFDKMVAVRGGYLLATDIDSEEQLYRFTAGAGINYQVGETVLTLDYSFRDSQYFDGNNLFSLKVGF